jgi:hypothetical protein
MEDTPVEEIGTEMTVKPKKLDAVGLHYYGDKFQGYMRIGDYKELIPQFKDFYYERRIKDPKLGLLDVVQSFNRDVVYPQGKLFHPYTTQLRGWIKKWNADIMRQQLGMREETAITPEKEIRQIVRVRGDEGLMLAPGDGELEGGLRTLGGELLNDAMQMLKDDQELEEVYEDEVLIKRRNYIVNVFAHATRLVHGKAALMLKASEEKRNNASFLMNILARATAGKLSDENMSILKVNTKQNEQIATQ